jgi:3-oxoacyl-[acyl-carrier protein] reductase
LTEGARDQLSQEEMKVIAQSIPLGEIADPLDMAYTMLFLSTDESRYITGQSLIVDGGLTLVETKLSMPEVKS